MTDQSAFWWIPIAAILVTLEAIFFWSGIRPRSADCVKSYDRVIRMWGGAIILVFFVFGTIFSLRN